MASSVSCIPLIRRRKALGDSKQNMHPLRKGSVVLTQLESNPSLANIFGGPGFESLSHGRQGPLLVANRGEIAIRIIRAAHELGMKAISIYSHEDRLSMHRYKVWLIEEYICSTYVFIAWLLSGG